MPRVFNAWGDVEVRDKVDAGLKRVKAKVRETVESVDAMEGTATLKADSTQVTKEVQRVEQKLRRLDRLEADVGVNLDTAKFEAERVKLQAQLARLKREKVHIEVEMDRNNLNIVNKGLATLYQRMRAVGRISPWGDIQKLGQAMHNARITLGPLSLSLRGLIVALITLAPLVTAAAGALTGLVASLGSAVVGAAGLGIAALGAFGLTMGGVFAIAKPLVGELGDLKKAQDAYSKSVKDYGKGSTQAETALKKLRSNLAATSPALRDSWKDMRKLSTTWQDLTKGARPQFFRTVADGLKTASTLMPAFAEQSNRAFTIVNRGMRDWLRGLRSAEGQNTMETLMKRANAATGPLMQSLGNIATFLARVSVSFSRFFAPLARDFRTWTKGLADGAGHTRSLNDTVDKLVSSFRAWIHLGHEVGRLIGNIFSSGSKDGDKMVSQISDLVGKWADFLGTKKGQRDMHEFLSDAWETTKKFADFLATAVDSVNELAGAAKPLVDRLLEVATWALKILNRLEDSSGAGEALVTSLAGLIILRRAVGWATTLVSILGGGAILKGFKGLAKFSLSKILFGGVTAASITARLGAILTAGVGGAVAALGGALAGAFAGFKVSEWLGLGSFQDSIDAAKRTMQDLGSAAGAVWGQIKKSFSRKIEVPIAVGRGVIGAARSVWNTVRRTVSRAVSFVLHLPNPIGAARSIWNRIKAIVSGAISFVFSLPNPIGAARSIWARVRGIITAGIQFVINLPGVGGLVSIASSIWSAVKSALPDITLHINIPMPSIPKIHIPTPHLAAGGAPGEGGALSTAHTAAAMENPKVSAMGGKVFAPRFVNNVSVVGEEQGNSEFVIPTNPRYRNRARRLMAQAMAIVGQGFARGVAAGKKKHKKRRPKKVYSGSHYLRPVQALEDEIAGKDNALTQADRAYNTESRFMPTTDDDGQRIESNIAWHLRELDKLAGRAHELSQLEQRLSKAIEKANKQLRDAMNMWRKKRPASTIIKGSGKDKKRVDNPAFKTWADKMEGLQSAYGEVPLSDAAAAHFRSDDYQSDADSYRADQREVRETKSAPQAGAGMEGFLRSSGLFATFQELNLSLAQASATIGDTSDDRAANAGLASFWEQVISRIGPGGDRDLLTEAYGNLASARSGAAEDTSGPTMESQLLAYDQARTELYKQFGGNMGGAGILGAITSGVTSGVVAGLAGGPTGPGGGSAPVGTAAGKSTVINQTNNFQAPPPDPHTFVQSVKWNAQAIL